MRRAFLNIALALPLLAIASTPAVAQDRSDDSGKYAREDARANDNDMRDFQTDAVAKLQDPRFQEQMGDVMGAMMQAMMSMKIGGIAKAAGKIDPNSRMAHVDPDTTVGDMVADGDPHYAANMADKTRAMAKTAGNMAGSMAQMMPVLARMAEDMGAQMERAMEKSQDQPPRRINR